jgi:hypothetical protein
LIGIEATVGCQQGASGANQLQNRALDFLFSGRLHLETFAFAEDLIFAWTT